MNNKLKNILGKLNKTVSQLGHKDKDRKARPGPNAGPTPGAGPCCAPFGCVDGTLEEECAEYGGRWLGANYGPGVSCSDLVEITLPNGVKVKVTVSSLCSVIEDDAVAG